MGDAAEARKHFKSYMMVFAALGVLTIITVAVSRVHFGSHSTNVVVALLIAALKASLVAAVFMHLKWEKSKSIWWSLGICGVFFVVLMGLPTWTYSDDPPDTSHSPWDVLPREMVLEAKGHHDDGGDHGGSHGDEGH